MLADDAWFVVATEPRAESRVSTRAGQLGITTYFPVGRRLVRRRRQLEARTAPAITGYVFVAGRHFSAFTRHLDAPDAVPHCIGWLSGADGPEPVPPEVVEDIKAREANGEFDTVAREGRYWAPRWLKPRARVRITEGPFAGRAGTVWRMTNSRKVAIWMDGMGGLRLIEFAVDTVARAEKTVARGSKANYG